MTPDGLMIGAQGPAVQVSPLGKGTIWAADGNEDHSWGLCLSRAIRTPGQDTASNRLLSIPPYLFSCSYFPQHRVGKCVTILSWAQTHKPLQTL